jgi:ATP-dependent Lon protease
MTTDNAAYFELSSDISTRDRDGVHKTFSGLMKLLFPTGEAAQEEVEELLKLALEGRKRVKDQLMRIDTTYPEVNFAFTRRDGTDVKVATLEETEYPEFYHRRAVDEADPVATQSADGEIESATASILSVDGYTERTSVGDQAKEGHFTFAENQRGVTFANLFGPYLDGAKKVTITDPYIRAFHQARNLMELLETIAKMKSPADEVEVHLITCADEFRSEKQHENFDAIEQSCAEIGINFSWEFDSTNTIHARHITSDTGWKISLDRGLDIFQQYEMNDSFSFANRLQQVRGVKAFEVTYLKVKDTLY